MTATHTAHAPTTKQNWAAGLMVFGAVMLMIAGLLAIFRGIMAIAKDDVFVNAPTTSSSSTCPGGARSAFALGAVAVLVSFGIFQAATWARVAGVAIAGLIIIANFLSLPYYPVSSPCVMIAISGFIIWALCVVRRDDSFEPFERPPHDV